MPEAIILWQYKESPALTTLTQQTSLEAVTLTSGEVEQIRGELRMVLESASFRRSERHSKFLQFVCEAALQGEAAKLNEYAIAHEVFGRGAEYSPGEDSVVRRQAHALRQRLHEYYEAEGRNDQLRIELPVGRYIPAFVGKEADTPEELLVRPLPVARAQPSPAFGRWPLLLAGLLVAGTLVMSGWMLGRASRHGVPSIDPALAEIWGPWLADPEGAVICFSNPMTAVVKQFSFSTAPDPSADPPPVALLPEQAELFRNYFHLPSAGHFVLFPAKSQSKTGEALGSVTLTSMLTRAGVRVRATQSRFLSWDNFRDQNLILLGHDEANRWLDPILDKLPIRMATNNGEKARRIVDSTDGSRLPREYYLKAPDGGDSASLDYALVSMLPGVDGKHQLLLINGLNTEGTQIAMEYLCDPRALRNLIARLRTADPHRKGNWSFQMVLRTEVRDQVPIKAKLLTVKIL